MYQEAQAFQRPRKIVNLLFLARRAFPRCIYSIE
jgi:hypothetical protein